MRSRNASLGVLDQGLSSLTNFLFVILVARVSTTTEFGEIALAIAWCQLAMGLGQEAVSQTHLVHGERSLQGARGALGASILLGAVIALPGIAVLAAFGSAWPGYAIVACLPILLLQDCLRFVFVREGLAHRAIISDSVWLAVVLAFLVGGYLDSTGSVTLAWLAGAAVATLAALWSAAVLPSFSQALRWHGHHARVAWRNAVEFGLLSGASQVAMLVVGKVAGLAAIGALRGASTLFGPINVLLLSMRLVLLPRLADNRAVLRRSVAGAGLFALMATALWSGLLLVLPDSIGSALLGPTWPTAHALVFPFAVQYLGLAVYAVAFLGLKALDRRRSTLQVRVWFAAMTVSCATAGAAVAGATGAAWGLAVAGFFAAGLAVFHFLVQDRAPASPRFAQD